MSKLLPNDIGVGDVLVVNVTQADIDAGGRISSQGCAIAQALLRLGYVNPVVFETVRVGMPWERVDYVTPPNAAAFIRAFDDIGHHAVKPSTFVFARQVRA